MKNILRRLRPSPAMVVACTALLFAMTGAGYAAGVVGPNSVGTKQLKKNAITSVKVKNRSLLAVDFKAGQLPQGPKGDPGAPGAPGQQGPAGPGATWATVSSTGVVLRQSGGITAVKVQTGGYRVTFPAEVTKQLILVTPALASDQTTRGTAIAGPCQDFMASCPGADISKSVSVFTLSGAGAQQDHSFTVSVMGPSSAGGFAPEHGAMGSKLLDSGK